MLLKAKNSLNYDKTFRYVCTQRFDILRAVSTKRNKTNTKFLKVLYVKVHWNVYMVTFGVTLQRKHHKNAVTVTDMMLENKTTAVLFFKI